MIELEVPSIAETEITGWQGTARFTIRKHDYTVRFEKGRTPVCLRDGRPVEWSELHKVPMRKAQQAGKTLLGASPTRY